ncbi:MAG: Rid family hydrolase [Solirubrobacterales bacterium]
MDNQYTHRQSAVTLAGPQPGYNRAARAGKVIALAGHTAKPEVIEAKEGFTAEFDSALAKVIASLEEIGGNPGDLLHLRTFVTDLAAYSAALADIGTCFRARLHGHYPASTLVEVSGLIGGAQVEIEGLATAGSQGGTLTQSQDVAPSSTDEFESVIRLRLAPADARYAGGIAAGSKSMEIFADLETELALREGGDEGLCVAYDMVEFLAPLRVGDFIEGRARVVERGRSSRRIAAEIHKVASVDEQGKLQASEPILAARASATIVVSTTTRDNKAS